MPDESHKTEKLSLWENLHDGSIEVMRSDLMARTLTVVVDIPFHWEFHKLPADTRFEIVGENVRVAQAFDFEPWPGACNPSQDTPWEEAKERRRADYEKGRLVSTDWNDFTSQVETDEDYLIMSAELETFPAKVVLSLGVMSYPNSNWRDVRIQAECFRFFVGPRELSLQDFQEFGSRYWDDWASKSKAQKPLTEHTSEEPGSE
jgi:hypothetical protein